jgi:two-component sensor histidine kinase
MDMMDMIVVAFYLCGTTFFFSALVFTYYGFSNARLMRGPLGHQLMAVGGGLFLVAIMVGAVDHFLFPGSGLVYVEFFIWIVGLTVIVGGGMVRAKEVQQVYEVSLLRILTVMPTAKFYLLGISVLLFISVPLSMFSIFSPLQPEPQWYNACNLALWTFSFAAMAVAERQFHLAVRPAAMAETSMMMEKGLLLREDILTLRGYADFASRLAVSALPMVGPRTLKEIVGHCADEYEILAGCEMTGDGVLLIEGAVQSLIKISEGEGIRQVLDGCPALISRLVELYSAVVSPELAEEMVTRNYRAFEEKYGETPILRSILEAVPEGFLEKEKLALLSREELSEKVRERTRELEESLIKTREATEALWASRASFHNIVERSTDGIIIIDRQGIVQFVNPAVESFFGLEADDLVGRPFGFSTTVGEIIEVDIARDGGQPGVAELRMVETEWEGAPASLALLRDITERKQAEEQIRSSLQEKEMLLKEIHHRVKNNLQVISSLLYLQSKSTREEEALAVLRESQYRIRSMALVHEKLYQTQDLIRVDFAEYVKSLADYLLRAYGVSPGRVRLAIDVVDVFLNIDTAIPCGLIINELVSNSLKHAFPDGRAGEIRIGLDAADGSHYTLLVADDGIGFPEHLNFRETGSLGLQLVNSLVDQLGGNIDLERCDGTKFLVVFAELRQREGQG